MKEEEKQQEEIFNNIIEQEHNIICDVHKEDITYLKKLIEDTNEQLKIIGSLEIRKIEMKEKYDNIQEEINFFQKQLFQKYEINPDDGDYEIDFELEKIYKK